MKKAEYNALWKCHSFFFDLDPQQEKYPEVIKEVVETVSAYIQKRTSNIEFRLYLLGLWTRSYADVYFKSTGKEFSIWQ